MIKKIFGYVGRFIEVVLPNYAIKCIEENNEYMTSPVPPTITEIDEDSYIKISFTADANHTIENIDFSVANAQNYGVDWRINKYTLKYDINGGEKVTLLDGVDISNTNSATIVNNQLLTPSIPLINGDIFSLYWYPFDVAQNEDPVYSSFWIADANNPLGNKVHIYNNSQSLLSWLDPDGTDTNNFVLGADVSSPLYSKGNNNTEGGYTSDGKTWFGFPVPYPSYTYLPSSSDDLDIEVDFDLLTASFGFQFLISYQSNIVIGFNGTNIRLVLTDINGINTNTEYDLGYLPSNGNIMVKGNNGNIDLYFNGLVVKSIIYLETFKTNPIDILEFNRNSGTVWGDVTFLNIRIGTQEWTFPEGSGSTTISSEGTITTLHSDVNTDPMWIEI